MLLPARQDQNLAGSSSMATHRLLGILRILNNGGLMCNRVAHAPAIALTDEPESMVLSLFSVSVQPSDKCMFRLGIRITP
ncbi:hypothetical protein VTI28DRAFT_5084 [Corynascus sepedonium]